MQTLVDARSAVVEALDKLGAMSADEIADLLRREGIRGVPSVSQICGLAMYLNKVTGVSVHVGATNVVLESWLYHGTRVWLPQSCRQFVHGFDRGAWPDLWHEEVRDRALAALRQIKSHLSVFANDMPVHPVNILGVSFKFPLPEPVPVPEPAARQLVGSAA